MIQPQTLLSSDISANGIRIIVCGEAGVGKTSIADCLCGELFGEVYIPTVGCRMQVLKQDIAPTESFFVEFYDIGGSPRYSAARSLFYDSHDAVIFVWDTNMEMTYHAIDGWLTEIKKAITITSPTSLIDTTNSFPLPLLIVGNKVDKLNVSDYESLKKSCGHHVLASAKNLALTDRQSCYSFLEGVYLRKRGRDVISPSGSKKEFLYSTTGDLSPMQPHSPAQYLPPASKFGPLRFRDRKPSAVDPHHTGPQSSPKVIAGSRDGDEEAIVGGIHINARNDLLLKRI